MKKTLAIVIPVYNEVARLPQTVRSLIAFKTPSPLTLTEIIFVDDGSTDKTKSQISNLKSQIETKTKARVKIISYRQNRGKGYAVRTGMLKATADYALLCDADMSTPLSELKKFVPAVKSGQDVIIGTRKNGHSTVVVHQPLYRELMGRGFTLLSQLILQTFVTDFTCGFKLFSKEASRLLFATALTDRWGYDAEVLFLANKFQYQITEVPVVWSNDPRTKVNLLSDTLSTLADLLKIRQRAMLGAYVPKLRSSLA